jgi:hypothetical protein
VFVEVAGEEGRGRREQWVGQVVGVRKVERWGLLARLPQKGEQLLTWAGELKGHPNRQGTSSGDTEGHGCVHRCHWPLNNTAGQQHQGIRNRYTDACVHLFLIVWCCCPAVCHELPLGVPRPVLDHMLSYLSCQQDLLVNLCP